MVERADALVVSAAQDRHDMTDAKALSNTVDAGQRLAGVIGGIEAFRRIQAHIAIAAIFVQTLAEIIQQHAPSTRQTFGQSDHGIEFVQFDTPLLGVVVVLDQLPRHTDVLRAIQQQRLGG